MHLGREAAARLTDEPDLTALILRAYEDAASGGVLVIGANRQVLSRNRRFLDMWRLAEAAVPDTAAWPLITSLGEQLPDPSGLVARMMAAERFCDRPGQLTPYQMLLLDGRRLELTGRSLDGSPDAAQGWVWYFREIEREARLAAALRKAEASERKALRSEAQLSNLCGNIPGIVLQMRAQEDGALSVPFISDHVRDLYGLSPDTVIADPLLLFRGAHPDDRSTLTAMTKTAFERAVPTRLSFRVVHAETKAIAWLRGGFVPTRQSDGSLLWDGVLVDVTLLKSREEELSRAMEQALQASRAKTEFLANMSHELRTPLNAIIGFSEVMLAELFGPLGQPRYVEYARDMHHSGHHLLTIINALLDVAKIEAGQMELDERSIKPASLIDDCLPFVREKVATGHLVLKLEVAADLPELCLDPVRMRQVLLNLLSNAAKFTAPGGSITISAGRSAAGGVALAIADTGIGMNEDEINVARQPFRQVDNALSRRYEGTGLGLPLAQRLTELHGGVLEIASVPGQGTTVTILLPPERVLG